MKMEYKLPPCRGKNHSSGLPRCTILMNRILVIDEDRQVRESVSLSLETAGYTVMVAKNSQEGLKRHINFQASLIIMDVVALLENREEESIQNASQQSPIPLITLTGNLPSSGGTFPFIRHIFRPICTLPKPFTVDELLQTVRRVLAH